MESNFPSERRRRSEPRAQLLVALLPVITVAGIAGSLCGVHAASLLLYWPAVVLVATAVYAFWPASSKRYSVG